MPGFSELVESALRVAACAHRKQRRKASDIPYIVHPMAVAMLLQQAGVTDPEVLAAAMLHDTVEDTDVTAEQLAQEFPVRVCEIVADLTERKHNPDGTSRTWEVRKQEHIDHVKDMSADSCAVLLADKLHNLSAILFDQKNDPDVWDRFSRPREKVIAYHEAILTAAAPFTDPVVQSLIAECRNTLNALKD